MATPSRRARRRALRIDRPALRPRPQGAEEGRFRVVPRPRLAARRGAGRFRGGGSLRHGNEAAAEFLRALVPLFERRVRPGVPVRELRMRVPSPQAGVRIHRRGPIPHRVRQRHRRRAQGLRRRQDRRDLRGLRRPLRLRIRLLQPEFRPREGQRGEEGVLHQAEPLRSRAKAVPRRIVQREAPGPMPRARQGALQERRERGRAVRRRPRRAGRIAGNAVRGGPLRRLQGRQAGQGPDRRPPLVLGGPVPRGRAPHRGAGRHDAVDIHLGRRIRLLARAAVRRRPHRFLEPGEPVAASCRQAGRVAQQLDAVGDARCAAGLHGRPRQARIGRRPEADEGPSPAFGLGRDRRRDAMRAGIDRQDRRCERRGGRRQGRGRRHRVRRAR